MGNIIDDLLNEKHEKERKRKRKLSQEYNKRKSEKQIEPNYIFIKIPTYLMLEINKEIEELHLTRPKYLESIVVNRKNIDFKTRITLSQKAEKQLESESDFYRVNVYMPTDVRKEIKAELEDYNKEYDLKISNSDYLVRLFINRKKILK